MPLGPIAASGATKTFYVSVAGRLATGETATGTPAVVSNTADIDVTGNVGAVTTTDTIVGGVTYLAGTVIEFEVVTTSAAITSLTNVELKLTYNTSLSNVDVITVLLEVVPKVIAG